MNPARIWLLGSIVAIVAIVAGAVGLGVQPQLATAAAADASTAQVRAQNSSTQIELARLSRLAATQSTLEATETKLESAVTGSLRLSTFSRQVRATAALDGVTLTSLSPSTATVYSPATATAAGATSSSTSSTASPTTTTAATPGLFGKTEPLITSGNFSIIPVTIVVSGDDAAGIQFASDVQHLDRLFAVSTVTFASATTTGALPTTTISGNIYALKR